jgi:hypothetical protein
MPSTCPGSRPIPSLLPGCLALKGTLARKIETFADQVGRGTAARPPSIRYSQIGC